MRRASQAAFILLLFLMPVFDILRYDAAARELYLFGDVWTLGLREGFYTDHSLGGSGYVAARFLLKAVLPWLVVLSIFPLLGVFLGRFFCGWLCPEGALFEYADYLGLKTIGRRGLFGKGHNGVTNGKRKPVLFGVLAALSLVVIPPVFGVFLSGYFIAPARIWHEIASFDLSYGLKAGILGVSAYMVVTFVLVRHALCKYVCAAGLMQMLFGWASPLSLRVRFDRANVSRCTDCRKCEKVCFMDVKPRSSRKDINCVNCGACVSACRKELGAGCGLFSFAFGEPKREAETTAVPVREDAGKAASPKTPLEQPCNEQRVRLNNAIQ